jgi:hypothetical protein
MPFSFGLLTSPISTLVGVLAWRAVREPAQPERGNRKQGQDEDWFSAHGLPSMPRSPSITPR